MNTLPGPFGAVSPAVEQVRTPGQEQVELYLRTYTTLLQSSGDLRLRTLEQTYAGMHSSLHSGASAVTPDLGALIYTTQRLPACMPSVQQVLMGQSAEVFQRVLGEDVNTWQPAPAPGRRRRAFFDGSRRLAVFIASQSDVDDLLPTLTAWQIEWNKLHLQLRGSTAANVPCREPWETLGGAEADWRRLEAIWGADFCQRLALIGAHDRNVTVRLLGGTQVGYAKATAQWWQPLAGELEQRQLSRRPMYFVSSNSHSVVNLLTGVPARHEAAICAYIEQSGDEELIAELKKLRTGASRGNLNNLLFYATRGFFASRVEQQQLRRAEEYARGVYHVPAESAIAVAGQIITLGRLDPRDLDPRLGEIDVGRLRASTAVILNIDYPLGLAAYNIMRQVMERTDELRGVYILGKAASLNAGVGDVMIPDVVHDEHSQNTYWLDNCFSFDDVGPFLVFGSALDHQRAVTVKGTFLQNRGYLDMYHRERYTAVEMEAGPYLNALYEGARPERYPEGQNINVSKLPFDLGVLHYASDTPYTQARTLGARSLDYQGMDSTYASAVAIVRRILQREGIASR